MPSPRTELRTKRGWTDRHKACLMGDHDFFGLFDRGKMAEFADRPGGIPYRVRDDEADRIRERMCEAWDDLRDELLPMWIAEHPFTRPRGWWTCEAPELRRCTNGVHPFERPEFIEHCERLEQEYPGYTKRVSKTWWGVPCISAIPGLDGKAQYESERDYLIRLDLLTDEERELLANESPTAPAAPAVAESTQGA